MRCIICAHVMLQVISLRDYYEVVIDAGCGTGLLGRLLRDHAHILLGIDLSSKMMQQADDTDLYDGLVVGSIVDEVSSLHNFYIMLCNTSILP
jgi:predicted TPR repeat methyltransferase